MKPLIRVKRNRDIQLSFTFVMPEGFEFVMNHCVVDSQRRTITPTSDQAVFTIRRKEVKHDGRTSAEHRERRMVSIGQA